jgi:hypothetical protein
MSLPRRVLYAVFKMCCHGMKRHCFAIVLLRQKTKYVSSTQAGGTRHCSVYLS